MQKSQRHKDLKPKAMIAGCSESSGWGFGCVVACGCHMGNQGVVISKTVTQEAALDSVSYMSRTSDRECE